MKSGLRPLAVSFLLLAAACTSSDTPSTSPPPTSPGSTSATTGPPPPYTGGPCPYDAIDPAKPGVGLQDFQNPPDERFTDGSKTLTVRYSDENTMLGGCVVTLRSYNGKLVGPTIRAKPGETIDFHLKNDLPPNNTEHDVHQEEAAAHLVMTPNAYNTTNVHTHGLHVSPNGNSDNVLLALEPGIDFHYEIKLPPDHAPGTFWYHAHAHGSTAIQVGSGMAGALIVEDDESKLPPPLLEATKREKIMVFESILYDTNGKIDNIAAFFPDSPTTAGFCAQGLDTCTWQNSKRRTTVNGQIVPRIHMQPGEVQRWRMIDATFRESLNIRLSGHPLHEIALDGLYTGQVDTWGEDQSVALESGYRSDVLVQASSTPGTYLLTDEGTSAGIAVRAVAEDAVTLAEVVVAGDPLQMTLPTDAQMEPLGYRVDVDLRNTAVGVQEVSFKIGSDLAAEKNYFQVNGESFDEENIRYVPLNGIQTWKLTTVGDPPGVPRAGGGIPPVPHVFHIHVNPFQWARDDPDGNEELVWKDTLLVPPAAADLFVYTEYQDFTGTFVMHCHILDHEDLGMMEVVEVVDRLPIDMEQPD